MRRATVIPEEGLRLRSGPDTSHSIIRVLARGEVVTITGAKGLWRRVDADDSRGFVHGDYITVDGIIPVNEEPAGIDPEIRDDEPEDNQPVEQIYIVRPLDTLSLIGARLGVRWQLIAEANGIRPPWTIFPGQSLVIPGAGSDIDDDGVPDVSELAGVVEILNPLAGTVLVTSSSSQGHHVPFGGVRSCDLALLGGGNPQAPAFFHVRAPAGVAVRGVVEVIGPACRSGRISDGGNKVQIRLEYQSSTASRWETNGAWVLYAHLDPVLVGVGDVVTPGQQIGRLGAADGSEYNSSCAQGSHIHVEATCCDSVVREQEQIGQGRALTIAIG